nr:hypothetical protein C1892_24400 [Pseudomonas sp. MPBD7-1]
MNTGLAANTCGSELARDSGGAVAISVDGADAIASKLAPTGGVCGHIVAPSAFTCGNDSAPRPLRDGIPGRNDWRCHSRPPGRYR